MSGAGAWCCCTLLCLWYLAGIALMAVGLKSAANAAKFKPVNEPLFTQLRTDWEERPFVDIKVVKLDLSQQVGDCPADYPDEVISEWWFGQTFGCDCLYK